MKDKTITFENILDEPNRDKRIEIVLVDTYDEGEQRAAFCVYLEDNIEFPFKAKLRNTKKSEVFTVTRFSRLDPDIGIVCDVKIDGKSLKVPITEIEPIDNRKNDMIIKDYLKWLGEDIDDEL